MRVVYVAHPLGHGEDRERNRANAAAWCGYLAKQHRIAPVADWIVLSGVWSEDDRDMGLAIDFRLIERCDALWLVGGRVSPGMALEAEYARERHIEVVDLTPLGYEVPST